MAERRMISKKITDTDAFLDMPLSTQALYFHLIQNADDDGFVGNPNTIARKIGANKNDADLLIAKRYILVFESGIIVIKHWKIHNYIQKDRYIPTTYVDEKSQIALKTNNSYTEKNSLDTKCIQNGYNLDTQYSIDKISIDKNKENKDIKENAEDKPRLAHAKHKYGSYKNVLLTEKEIDTLRRDYTNADDAIEYLSEYIEMKGYKAKSHYLAIKKWVFSALEEQRDKNYKFAKTHGIISANFTQRNYSKNDLDKMFKNVHTTDDIDI
jgi:hypothetical protein